jgi:hypothetical protein
MSIDWVLKKRGWSKIYTSSAVDGAIVDTQGYGTNPRISRNGVYYSSVEEAKSAAEYEVNKSAK